MIGGSEKRKRQLAFELQRPRVFEKRSNYYNLPTDYDLIDRLNQDPLSFILPHLNSVPRISFLVVRKRFIHIPYLVSRFKSWISLSAVSVWKT